MKAITSKLIVLLVLCIGLTGFGWAQDRTMTEVDSICKTALKLPLDKGIALITSSFEKYSNTDHSSRYLLKLNFTAGYLFQIASDESTDNRQSLLEKSLVCYQKAHEIDPTDISVLNNLFLVNKALGNTQAAIKILDKAIKADQKNRAKYFINLGDIYSDNKDLKRAVELYKRAFFEDVNNEGLAWKIFQFYAQFPNPEEAFKGLYSFSGELFEKELNDLARSGFIYAINNSLSVNDIPKAEEACVRWAETIAGKNTIAGNYVGELPDIKTWPADCNTELQLLLTNTYRNVDNLRWWLTTDFRRHIVASILLKMESAALMKSDLKSAVKMLETSLNIAPDFYVYERDPRLRIYFPVKMDVAIELSRLYNRYPKLDLDHAKFDAIISELFNEKSQHYLENDLESIQKSHTMLGLIYADRNVWQSPWYAGNAIFQLERAIEVQKKIEDKNPEKFKPIPSLNQMLAKGYRITNQPEKECQKLIDAAAGYLDLDNLSMADSILQKAKKIPSQNVVYIQKLKEIGLITDMRFNIRNDKFDFRESNANALEKSINESELFGMANSKINAPLLSMTNTKNDQSFLNRQKFKILSDMGSKYSELNPAYTYPIFEIKALDYINKEKALGNYQDINRLNHIESKFTKNLGSENVIRINQNSIAPDVKEKSKSWTLNTGVFQTRIEANQDLIVAGKVYEKITNEKSDKAVEGLDQIQINKGNVIIPNDLKDKETIDKAKIQHVKGVKKVQIIDKLKIKTE